MSLLAQTSTQQLITSSITAKVAQFQTLTSIEAYISSLTVDSLAIGSNSGFINMGDIITTSHSSLQINTGLLTASGVVCTPQMIVSSINGQTISQLATVPVQSTMIGLGTAGYVSTASLQSTFAGINYAISQNTVDTVFYLNPGTPAPTYRQMSPNQTMLPQSTLTTFITKNTSNIPIAQFQTDFTIPQVIPGGAWDINLFSYTDHANVYIYTSLFSRAGATETLLVSSSNATTNIGTSPVQQYTNTVFVPQTIFTSTTGVSLVLKVFANNPINQDDNLYTYYQGGNYSHVHTTFGTVIPDTLFTSTVQGLGSAGYLSTLNNVPLISSLQMNTSSIVARNVSSATGYISSLRTDNLTVGGADGYVTIQDLTTGTASTGQLVAGAGFISSLQINSLSFGPSGYVIVGNFIASSLSTMKLNTQNLYTNNAYIGNVSSQSAILFPGVDATFRGTAVAEQVTGPGTGELLLYKVSTGTDQIRLQTTGNIVFEAGASARSWPSTQTLATPTMYIAGSTSNVGIGTAAPGSLLDVAGTARAQTISTLALNVSSINGAAYGGSAGGSFNGSSFYLSTTQATINALTIPYSTIVSNNIYLINTTSSSVRFGTTTSSPSQIYIGDVNTQINLSTNNHPTVLVEQQIPISNVRVSTITTSGSFVVPANVTFLNVHLWGSGGGGAGGGGGAYVSGILPVTPGTTLAIAVGAGGGSPNGGGYAGIFTNSIAVRNILVIAGGGGGTGSRTDDSGGYGGIIQGGSGGYRGVGQGGPVGGSQTINTSFSAWQLQGDGTQQAGGGGGYWGGASGGNNSVDVVGGGGGSSYVANLLNFYGENGSSSITGGFGGGKGTPYNSGTYGDAATAGAVVLVWSSGIRRANMFEIKDAAQRRLAISESLYMGINVGSTISSNYNFEVRNGIGAISTLFTTSLSTTSLTIPFSNYNPSFLPSTFPIYAMNTMSNGAQIAFGTGGMYGTIGKYAQFYINDVKQLTNQFSATDPLLLIEQDFPTASNANVVITPFSASGTFTVPATITAVRAYMWGQGGQNSTGGGGAFVCGTFTVTPGDTIQVAVNYGGGGGGFGSGGGLAGVFRGTISQANAIGIAAGGGAGGSFTLDLGGYGGVVSGSGGTYRWYANATTGGSQTAAGTGSGNGAALAGGTGSAGGGAGYWGGGAGANNSVDVVGGGGGSCFLGGLFNVLAENGQQGSPNGGALGGGKWAPFNNGIYGDAGSGVSGYVVLVYTRQLRYSNLLEIRTSYTSNITAITNTNSMGINVSSVGSTFSLDVGGVGRFQTLSTFTLNVSSINGAAPGGGTPFTGSTISLSSASLFTSSLQASTIGVGGGAWMSNDGLYLSNAQAGGAVGKLITNAGYVKLMTGTAWNGGYGALAITGGDLVPKVYMGMGTSVAGGNLAIGGLSPSPGGGITLDVFGAARFSSISSFQEITSSIGIGIATPFFPLDVAGLARVQILSTLALNVSSINGALPNSGGGGGTTFVGSTTFLSAAQLLVSTQTNYNLSSVLGYVSSLQVDELQIGNGYGIIGFGDTQMSSVSSIAVVANLGQFMTMSTLAINASSITGVVVGATFTGNLGTVSSLTALKYYGLSGLYQNSVVAEVSTGAGTQELLLYKVSSISDQIRVQTTGNVIFEAGVGARGWPTAPRATNPTFYIAGSNSNVGVGTSNPLTTFDVVGTGRFQTLSSLNITAGSINYSVAFV